MKFARILPSVFFLTCLLAMGCGEKTDSATAETPSQATGKPHHGPGVMKQIPAAEVLGSTVKRNLRYQPEEETNAILPLDKYLEYIRQVGLSLRKEIGKLPAETPGSGTVVVGLNAAGENRAWYVFPDGQPSAAFKAAVQQALAEVEKPKLNKSLIVFGVALTLWGYQESDEEEAKIELPKEWKAITERLKADQPATKLAEMTWSQAVQ